MSKKENHNLTLHLTLIGLFLIVVFSSCTTTYYLKHYDYSSGEPEPRYKITEKDLQQFSTTIRHRQQDPERLYRQAIYFQRINKHKLALEVLEEALLIDTKYAKAYNAMGVSFDELGDHDRAIEAYQRALRINPDSASVRNNLGYAYLLQGNTDAAIEAFQSAITLDSGNAKYHNNLGTAYAQKELFDQALDEFVLASGEARGHYNMAQIYLRMGRSDKAQYHLARAERPAPSANDAISHRGEAKSVAVTTRIDEKRANDQPTPAFFTKNIKTANESPQMNTGKESAPPVQAKLSQPAVPPAPEKIPTFSIAAITHRNLSDVLPADSQLNSVSTQMQKHNSARPVKVEISNGNGVNRMARRVGEYLNGGGIEVTRLTNAKHFNFSETIIFYHDDYIQDALDIAQQLPGLQLMQKMPRFGWPNIRIKVLIGKDLVPHNGVFSKRINIANKVNTDAKRQ